MVSHLQRLPVDMDTKVHRNMRGKLCGASSAPFLVPEDFVIL